MNGYGLEMEPVLVCKFSGTPFGPGISKITSVNVEINKMAVWFRANKLAVNKGKTKYMIFRTKGKNYRSIYLI